MENLETKSELKREIKRLQTQIKELEATIVRLEQQLESWRQAIARVANKAKLALELGGRSIGRDSQD